MTRTQIAEQIALNVRVFVRKARRDGHSNLITVLAIQETAERLGYKQGTHYSIRTVKSLITRECALMGETDLIGF